MVSPAGHPVSLLSPGPPGHGPRPGQHSQQPRGHRQQVQESQHRSRRVCLHEGYCPLQARLVYIYTYIYIYIYISAEVSGLKDCLEVENLQDQSLTMLQHHVSGSSQLQGVLNNHGRLVPQLYIYIYTHIYI